MQSDNDPLTGRRQLTSWKEIAQFLGRSVRTVQDWERREGLPVHRHRHHRRDSVYAYSDDLEKWWRQREAPLPSPPPDEADAAATPKQPPRRRTLLGAAAVGLIVLTGAPGARVEPRETIDGMPVEIEGRAGSQLMLVRIADLDGDQRSDVILNATEGREIYLVLGGTPPSGRVRAPDIATVTIKGTTGSGLYFSQVGDFNGDALNDLVVNERLGEPDGYSRSGSSYIVWGRRTWPESMVVPEQADVTIAVQRAPDAWMFGCLRGSDDDLNGDGIADIWLAASEYGDGDRRSAGSVFVVYGRRHWPRTLEVASAADVTFRGSRMGEGLAAPCVLSRDASAPGGRVAIVANENRLWQLLGGAGRLYVFVAEGGWPRVVDAATARFQISAPHRAPQAWNVAAGDVNGDGHVDIVGAINRVAGAAHPGEVRIWFGNRERSGPVPAESADVLIVGASLSGGHLGQMLQLDDIDGDSLVDVILAEPGRGQVHIAYGRPDWPRQGTLASFGAVTLMTGGDASVSELVLGDVDADLLPDLIVASSAYNHRAGRVSISKPYVPVRLEVRPMHDPNPIILPRGVCVARVYGWSAAARDQLDPATLRLAGASPTRHVTDDFNRDGFEDVQLYVETALMRVSNDTTRIAVRGRTVAGVPVGGTDAVVIVSGTDAERDQF